MAPRAFSESEVLKLARTAYRQGDAMPNRYAELGVDQSAWFDDPDMQEAELMVLRKGFARVLSAAEIVRQLRPA